MEEEKRAVLHLESVYLKASSMQILKFYFGLLLRKFCLMKKLGDIKQEIFQKKIAIVTG